MDAGTGKAMGGESNLSLTTDNLALGLEVMYLMVISLTTVTSLAKRDHPATP